jgi:hypothetical protein
MLSIGKAKSGMDFHSALLPPKIVILDKIA